MHRYPLQNDWYFTPQFDASLPVLEAPTDALTPVRLPHTVKELPFNGFSEKLYQMVSGYVRFLKVPEDWQGLRVAVTFDGAAHFALVEVGGCRIDVTVARIDRFAHRAVGGTVARDTKDAEAHGGDIVAVVQNNLFHIIFSYFCARAGLFPVRVSFS